MKRSPGLSAAALLALAAGSAQAHSPIAGIGHFYGGMLHPLLVPSHLIALIAMGLWLAQQGPSSGRAQLALVIAVPVGMAAGALSGWPRAEILILALAAVVALAAGLARSLPAAWRAAFGATLGALIGADSLPDGLSGRALWMSLGGTWLAVALGLVGVMALCELAVRPWMKIGLRALASWLAAAAILVLALSGLGPGAKQPATKAPTPPAAATR